MLFSTLRCHRPLQLVRLAPALLAAQVGRYGMRQFMVLEMGVFHRISSCMEKPESRQIEGLDSAADAGETPASAVTHGVRAPGFDSLFKTSLAR